jgi:RimJ/RimL family protein N-acetyltransferase
MNCSQINVIRLLKSADQSGDVAKNILIRRADREVIGKLTPLDELSANDQFIIAALTLWRKKFMSNFLTQFEVTIERTRRWLNEVVLKDNTRILFIIFDGTGKAIGNIGVCNISENQAELDNVIRGEKVGDPGFMFFVGITILSWLYWGMGVDSVVLHVFSNNVRAINLYSNIGFSERQRFDLRRICEGEDVKYLVDSINGIPVDFQYVEMAMDRSHFEASNPWAKAIYSDQWLGS